MATFRSDDTAIQDAYASKRHLTIVRTGHPASDVCLSCWAQQTCLNLVFSGDRPKTCCVYDYFLRTETTTIEDMVKYTCEHACVLRQKWDYDRVPHDDNYCKHHCPVSRFLTDKGPSSYEP